MTWEGKEWKNYFELFSLLPDERDKEAKSHQRTG